jgi:hypothetical protein
MSHTIEFKIFLDIIFLIIIIIGILSNIVNIAIFSSKNMFKMPTFRYLFYISIIDLSILLICATDSLVIHRFDFEIRLVSTSICKIHVFLTYYLTHLSSMMLMIVSIERTCVIYNKRILFFRLESINISVLFICTGLALVNSHYLYFFTLNLEYVNYEINLNESNYTNQSYKNIYSNHYNFSMKSNVLNENQTTYFYQEPLYICHSLNNKAYTDFLFNVWVFIDSSLYSFIPFCIMLVCSTLIMNKLFKNRRHLMLSNSNSLTNHTQHKRNNQILYMLIVTNFAFIVFSLPYSILNNNNIVKSTHDSLHVAHILAYSNNSFNFIFYVIFSVKYRSEFYNLLFRIKKSQDIS